MRRHFNDKQILICWIQSVYPRNSSSTLCLQTTLVDFYFPSHSFKHWQKFTAHTPIMMSALKCKKKRLPRNLRQGSETTAVFSVLSHKGYKGLVQKTHSFMRSTGDSFILKLTPFTFDSFGSSHDVSSDNHEPNLPLVMMYFIKTLRGYLITQAPLQFLFN